MARVDNFWYTVDWYDTSPCVSTRDGYGAGASNYQFRIPPDGCACFKYAQRTLELRNATTNATIEVFTPRSAALTS